MFILLALIVFLSFGKWAVVGTLFFLMLFSGEGDGKPLPALVTIFLISLLAAIIL